MKKIVLVLIILFGLSVKGQDMPIGEFCTPPIGESDVVCYQFYNNNQFDFTVSGCLGISSYGKGEYSLKGGKLSLHFDSGKGNENSKISFSTLEKEQIDSILIKIKVVDLTGSGIPAEIYPKDIDIKDFDFEKNYANMDGNWILKDKKEKTKKTYVISHTGFSDIEVVLQMDQSQEIKIILAPSSPDSISSKEFLKDLKIVDSDNLEIDGIKFKKTK